MGRGRWIAVAAVLALSAAATAFWFLALGPIREHRHWNDRVRADLDSLADKRPVDVPPGQWEFMVGWTINLHLNSAAARQWVDRRLRPRPEWPQQRPTSRPHVGLGP
jgi:hypothetical protein